MADTLESFDRFIALLDRLSATPRGGGRPDAIDAVLSEPARRTAAVPLRDSAVVRQFRDDLTDGLIRADTVNQLLRLASVVLERLPI